MTMTLATCSTILLLVLLGQSSDSHWQLVVFIWHASQPRQKESISFAQKLTLDVLPLSTIYSQFYWANKSFFTLIISIIHYYPNPNTHTIPRHLKLNAPPLLTIPPLHYLFSFKIDFLRNVFLHFAQNLDTIVGVCGCRCWLFRRRVFILSMEFATSSYKHWNEGKLQFNLNPINPGVWVQPKSVPLFFSILSVCPWTYRGVIRRVHGHPVGSSGVSMDMQGGQLQGEGHLRYHSAGDEGPTNGPKGQQLSAGTRNRRAKRAVISSIISRSKLRSCLAALCQTQCSPVQGNAV